MKKILYGLLALIWMAVIFYFSHQPSSGSTQITNEILIKILSFFNFDNIDELVTILFLPIRKLAHLTIYLILAVLLCNFFKEFNLNYKELFVICLFSCIIYAISDEIHQTYVFGRSGNIIDVSIDTIGSLIGIFLYTKIKKNSIQR